ncbi:MAG: hypothetical protein L6Q54_11020 [Leptospiraceae bacterium]|nr:hypothetical protein [Leptospiraceae bacterium]MCK6381759.1 hypothetical protein [Leptospiraceae bacterium]
MSYNPKIHKRRPIRLKGYDYSQAGLYFITICCKNKEYLFGNIANGEMVLNDAGKIANQFWMDIPNHFPNAKLHEYVVMPNHVHGIIELIENHHPPRPYSQNQFQKMIPRSISSIVKGYKIGVTKWFRNASMDDFPIERAIWQRNYYEHIIRNEQLYWTISKYIKNNPANWHDDEYY